MSESANSLIRGLLILECFTAQQPRLTQARIQRMTGIPKSTVFRLLKALTERNYLKYDPESRQYHLGPRVLSLGFSVLQSLEVREIVRPYLEMLARDFGRSASLLMLDGHEMVYIERIRVPSLRDFNISVGSRVPVYNTASGRAVLAHIDREKLQNIIGELKAKPAASPTIGKDGARLLRLLAEVQKQGYAINDEESIKGVRAVAVPIFSSNDAVYATSIVVPPEEVSVEELRVKYAPRLMEVGREISEALGYRN